MIVRMKSDQKSLRLEHSATVNFGATDEDGTEVCRNTNHTEPPMDWKSPVLHCLEKLAIDNRSSKQMCQLR